MKVYVVNCSDCIIKSIVCFFKKHLYKTIPKKGCIGLLKCDRCGMSGVYDWAE